MPRWDFGYRHPETGELTAPNPKQAIAHGSPADSILYGGAAGGGKSDFLIVEGIKTCLTYPRVEVALFRQQHTDLELTIIPRFFFLLPPKLVRWNSNLGRAIFPNGSLFWFLYCRTDSDVYRYQSAQWAKLLIDEATHFNKFRKDYLTTRLRRARTDVRKQLLLSANPGNVGHGWAKREFVKPTGPDVGDRPQPQPLDIWRPLPPKNRPNARIMTRQFIPAYVADNLILQQTEPDYIEQLYAMGAGVGRQLAEGDWDANDGMMFGEDWLERKIVAPHDRTLLAAGFTVGQVLPWHVIPRTDWRPDPEHIIYGSVDYGYGAPFSFHLHAVMPGGHVRTFFEIYKTGWRDKEQARIIRRVIERFMGKPDEGGCLMQKPKLIVYDPQMDGSRQEMGISESISEVYQKELGIPLQILLKPGGGGPGARLSRIQRVKDALSVAPDGFPWWTITATCKDLIRTLPELPKDPDDVEFILDTAEDHAYEDCGRFFQTRPVAPRAKPHDAELAQLDPLSRANAEAVLKKRGDLPAGVKRLDVKGLTP